MFIPFIIFALIITETIKLISKGYENYPGGALLIAGWGVVIILPVVALIFAGTRRKKAVPDSEVVIPKTPFIGDLGYLRLNRYLYCILILAVLMAALVILSNYVELLKSLIIPSIGICIFLALVGGAIYFTIISIKDGHLRDKWAEQALKSDE